MPRFLRPIYLSVCLLLAGLATSAAQTITYSAPLEITHDKPFVMVMINGKGPFRFVIDTGTGGQAFITPQLAKELGLAPVGYVRLNDLSGKGGQRVPLLLLPSLVVAGVEFSQVTAAQHEFSDADGTCQGLLGFPLFQDFLLEARLSQSADLAETRRVGARWRTLRASLPHARSRTHRADADWQHSSRGANRLRRHRT